MATGIEPRTIVGWIVEPSERAPIRSTQAGAEAFTATGNGTTSTTVSTGVLTFATEDGYIGNILRCVGGTAGNVGVDVEIIAFTPGSDTLTHTEFPVATATGDQFCIYTPPDPIVPVTTGGGTNTVTSTYRTESTTDYWDQTDYLMTRVQFGVTCGSLTQITSFNPATDVIAVSPDVTATAVGDLFYIRRFPKWWGAPNFQCGREDLTYETQRGNFDRDQSIPGCKAWSFDGVLPWKGSGTSAGNGTAGVPAPETHRPLAAVFATSISTGEAIEAGSTTSVVQVTNGTLAQFPVGSLVMDSAGRAAVVTATAADGANPDDITVNPPLQRAPIAAEILYGGYAYIPQTTGHLTMTIDCYKGMLINQRGYGGMLTSLKLVDFGRNKIPKFQFGYKGGFYLETALNSISATYTISSLTPTFDTVRPVDAKDCHAILVASGTTTNTRLIVEEASIDFGIETAEETAFTLPDGNYGYRIVGFKPVVSIKGYLDRASPNNTYAEMQRYWASGTFSLLLQHDKRPGYTCAFYAHRCSWLSPKHSVANKLNMVDFTAEVVASELSGMTNFLFGTV